MTGLGNNLLRALSQTDLAALQPFLKTIRANGGQVLQDQGADVNFTYFPCGASLVAFEVLLIEGKGVETNLIGREGAVGGIVSHGHLPAYARARVVFPGEFLRIETAALEKVKTHARAVERLFARYSDCLVAQILQSAACNAAHPVEQRAAKWLRFALDRTSTCKVPLTQEQLAHMLGVSRTYMTRVIQRLKTMGVLDTHRGVLCVRDPILLQKLCCGCHDAVCHHFQTVMKGVYPSHEEPCTASPAKMRR